MTRETKSNHDDSMEALFAQLEEYRHREGEYLKIVAALKEREQFHFELFQYFPEATIIVDRCGRVIKTNVAKQRSGDRLPAIGDVMYRDYASRHSIDMHQELLNNIQSHGIKSYSRLRYGNKILSITIAGFPGGAIITSRDITAQTEAEEDRIKLIRELQKALDEVEQLRTLLPICSSCKKIRDDNGYWKEVETYFSHHRNMNFSHSLCPPCAEKLYPELWESMQKKPESGDQPPGSPKEC
jgi:hypothetical protein